MTGPMWGILMLLVAVVAGIWHGEQIERRRFACDGCRTEALGSSMPYLRHTCSRHRANYEDKRGNVFQFGRRLR